MGPKCKEIYSTYYNKNKKRVKRCIFYYNNEKSYNNNKKNYNNNKKIGV